MADRANETPEQFVQRMEVEFQKLGEGEEVTEDRLRRELIKQIWMRDAERLLLMVSNVQADLDKITTEDSIVIAEVVKDLTSWLIDKAAKRKIDGELFREVADLEVSGDTQGIGVKLSKHAMDETRFGVKTFLFG